MQIPGAPSRRRAIPARARLAAALAAASLAAAPPAAAQPAAPGAVPAWQAGDVALRARVLGILVEAEGDVPLHGGTPRVSDEAGGELALSWFPAPQLSLELGVAGSVHRVGVEGARPVIGSPLGPVTLPRRDISLDRVGIVAPMLSAQWHPLPGARISPYLGAGIGYAVFIADGERIDYTNAVFPVLRAGVDLHATERLSFNFDVRRAILSTEAKGSYGGQPVSAKIDLDQWVLGFGVTFRF